MLRPTTSRTLVARCIRLDPARGRALLSGSAPAAAVPLRPPLLTAWPSVAARERAAASVREARRRPGRLDSRDAVALSCWPDGRGSAELRLDEGWWPTGAESSSIGSITTAGSARCPGPPEAGGPPCWRWPAVATPSDNARMRCSCSCRWPPGRLEDSSRPEALDSAASSPAASGGRVPPGGAQAAPRRLAAAAAAAAAAPAAAAAASAVGSPASCRREAQPSAASSPLSSVARALSPEGADSPRYARWAGTRASVRGPATRIRCGLTAMGCASRSPSLSSFPLPIVSRVGRGPCALPLGRSKRPLVEAEGLEWGREGRCWPPSRSAGRCSRSLAPSPAPPAPSSWESSSRRMRWPGARLPSATGEGSAVRGRGFHPVCTSTLHCPTVPGDTGGCMMPC
mmetsp:Transcript_11769/g.45909  ORF Transcript_11769/g.45909 Transcript_11769/m.45909 type:complete len:399 (+) Transcript_11769:1312-2508(+)